MAVEEAGLVRAMMTGEGIMTAPGVLRRVGVTMVLVGHLRVGTTIEGMMGRMMGQVVAMATVGALDRRLSGIILVATATRGIEDRDLINFAPTGETPCASEGLDARRSGSGAPERPWGGVSSRFITEEGGIGMR